MISQQITKNLLAMSITILILFACTIAEGTATESAVTEPQITLPTATLTPESTFLPAPQPFATPASFGPNKEDFPKGYNPLSGQPVEDPNLLQVPAMLISISHFPPVARPQAGLSFAPWVFEFYITEGATRFFRSFTALIRNLKSQSVVIAKFAKGHSRKHAKRKSSAIRFGSTKTIMGDRNLMSQA